ncbi:MAG: extracellular solute-binding protein [Endozoicomonas sp.]
MTMSSNPMDLRSSVLLQLLLLSSSGFYSLAGMADKNKEGTTVIRSLALIGEARYGDDFHHFDYVNPDAPKRGRIRLSTQGTFDTLNQYSTKGKNPDHLHIQYDRLMVRSRDEPYSLYPLIASSVEYPDDFSWVAFNLNPKAHFHDGQPVTSEDVLFTVATLKNNSSPFFKNHYKTISLSKSAGPHRAVFTLEEKSRTKKVIAQLAHLPVLPRHFWQDKDFNQSAMTIPMGSGPMKIIRVDPAHSVTYQRVSDYWAKDLPVNRGQYNFDELRIDFYRDNQASLEAFAAGTYDLRLENDPRSWHQKYDFPAIKNGSIVMEKIHLKQPHGMAGVVFNTRRPMFQDRRVRLALNYLFDFEWVNEHLMMSEYQRTPSFFMNTPLAAEGLPTGQEKKLLEEHRQQLAPELFTVPIFQPATDGSGNDRQNQKIALQLLKDAGWEFKDGQMRHLATGTPMSFELLMARPYMETIYVPYATRLAKLGIQARIKSADDSQYRKRARSFDFDMIEWNFWHSTFPGIELANAWSSKAADLKDSNNLAGVKHPVIDALLEPFGQVPDYQEMIPRCRAIDRVLLWENYVIPKWEKNHILVAYRSFLKHPKQEGLAWFDTSNWWYEKL